MIENIEKFGVMWSKRDAKTNTLYTVNDESLYNSCNVWFMLVQDRNNITQYLAFHNTSKNKDQIITNIRTSTYSKRQKLYEIDNINLNRSPNVPQKSRFDYDTIFEDRNLYAIPEQCIDVIEKIDANLTNHIKKFKNDNQIDFNKILVFLNTYGGQKYYKDNENMKKSGQAATIECQKFLNKINFDTKFNHNFTLNKYQYGTGNAYCAPYFWIQYKKSDNQSYPFSISVALNTNQDKNLQVLVKTEFQDNIFQDTYLSQEKKEEYISNFSKSSYNIPQGFRKEVVNIDNTNYTKTILIKEIDVNQEEYNIIDDTQRAMQSLIPNYNAIFENTINIERESVMTERSIPLNQILYGPPGTGKTYNTIIEAMKILTFEGLFRDWYLKVYCQNNKVDSKEKTLNDYIKYLTKINDEFLKNDNIFRYFDPQKFEQLKSYILSSKYITEDSTKNNKNSYYQHGLKRYEEFLNWLTYDKIREKFNEYKNLGQIEFVTFHQSYSYEEFVEGIKPVVSKNNNLQDNINHHISYECKDGIFKEICEHAKPVITTSVKHEPIDFSNTKVFKMSLGNTLEKEDDIYDYCIENNVVSLGWKDVDFSNCKASQDFKNLDDSWGATALERFVKWMDIGDIIIVSNGNRNFRAIAQVKSDYIYDKNTPISHSHFRKVEWLYKGDDIHYSKINDKIFSQQSIYGYFAPNKKGQQDYNPDLKTDELNKIITGEVNKEELKPHILIIDEINRGNISKIFGELITLIEEDKRGILSVKLPYSQDSFAVPKNLYIIGTMNTSDRSIASIDIALRRRFKFKEMMPDSSLVADFAIGFNTIFDDLNNKIKLLLDRDHQIGHSYFINTKYNDNNGNNNVEILKDIWFSEILPLLNEYFYSDWEKLKLIIPGFIRPLDVLPELKNECDDSIYEFKTFDEVIDFEKALNQEKCE